MNGANSIKNWSEEEQPRERLMNKGAAALSDAELLTILISSGTKEKSAKDLAREVLALAGDNLRELGKLNLHELQTIKGIGEARAITICAAMELGRRRQISEGIQRGSINKSSEAINILMPLMQDLNHEVFCIVYLNTTSKIIKHEFISSGGINATVVDVRMILKNCLLYNASQFIAAHNHPSGSTKPSEADIRLTVKLRDAAAVMDIKLLDHIIIAGHNFLSLSDEGFM
jgi:DNA repair protein RadC